MSGSLDILRDPLAGLDRTAEPATDALTVDPEWAEGLRQQGEALRTGNVGVLDQLGAAFERFNTVALGLEAFQNARPTFEADPNFDPYEALSYQELRQWGSTFVTARSREELEWLRSERERLDRLDALLAGGPLHPFVAGMVASIVDPINLLPVGWAGTVARGASVGSRLAQGAAIGVAANLAVEPFMQAADPFRGLDDAVIDLTFGGVIGAGFVGAPAAFRAGRAARAARAAQQADVSSVRVVEAQERLFAEAERIGVAPVRLAEARAGMAEAIQEVNEAVMAARAPEGGGTVGAMTSRQADILDDALRTRGLEMAGPRWLQKAGQIMAKTAVTRYPGWTLISSRFDASRRAIVALADIGIFTKASARELTEADFKAAYKTAVNKGWAGTEEDFLAIAAQRVQTGLAQAKDLPLFSRIDMWRGRFAQFNNAFVAAAKEAKDLGFTGSLKEFDQQLARYARFLEEPDRFNGVNPFEGAPFLPAMDAAIKAWQGTIAKSALAAIQRSGVWQDIVDGAAPRANYFPKGFDRERVVQDLPGFQQRWVEVLTETVDRARETVNAYRTALDAWTNRVEQRKAFRAAAQKAQAQGKDPNRYLAPLMKHLRAEELASKQIEELEQAIRKDTKKTAFEFLEDVRARIGRSADEVSPWELDYLNKWNKAVEQRDAAALAYQGNANRVAKNVEEMTGLPPPPVRAVRPETPPGYDKAKTLVDRVDNGELNIRTEAASITQDIAFGADPARYMEVGVRAHLRGRGLDADPARFADFFEQSFFKAVENYNSMVARDVETFKTFGSLREGAASQALMDEAMEAQARALAKGDTALAERIAAEAQRDKHLIDSLVAKARGTFDRPRSEIGEQARGAINTGMQIAFMARMGSGLLAQIGDLTTGTLRYGAARVFGSHASAFASGLAQTRQIRERAADLGVALDWALNDHSRLLYDVAPARNVGAIGRAVNRLTPTFSKLTLMPLWNDHLRLVGLNLVDDMLVRAAMDAKAGKSISREAADLFSRAGMTRGQVVRLAEVLDSNATVRSGPKDLMDSNLEAWTASDPELSEAYRGALHLGAQRVLLVPTGADAPLWTQYALGSMATQFKRFVFASLPQQLVPFLQSPAGRKIETLAFAVALGTLATVLRDLNARGEVKERSAAGWAFDALDLSGLTSALTEIDATMGKFSPYLSARGLLTGEDYTRFRDRTQVQQLLGPVASMAIDGVPRAFSTIPTALDPDADVTKRQIAAIRTLLPFQNHLLLRHGIDVIEASAGGRDTSVVLDWIEPDRPRSEQR